MFLELVEGDHNVKHVLRHAVGVRVINLLLRVVRREPTNLNKVHSSNTTIRKCTMYIYVYIVERVMTISFKELKMRMGFQASV